MFQDGKSLWESLAAIRSTPVSAANLPSPEVLLQGRHLRGNLPFVQLEHRQAAACFSHGGRSDVRGSALVVGQKVRAYVSGLWLPGAVKSVCVAPNSYVVQLLDGRVFRRTRRDINIDNSVNSSSHSQATVIAAKPGAVAQPTVPPPLGPPTSQPESLQPAHTPVRRRPGRPPGRPPASARSQDPVASPSGTSVVNPTSEATAQQRGVTRSGRPYLK